MVRAGHTQDEGGIFDPWVRGRWKEVHEDGDPKGGAAHKPDALGGFEWRGSDRSEVDMDGRGLKVGTVYVRGGEERSWKQKG